MGTRTSGPVINRISNPAIHIFNRIPGKSLPLGIRYFDIGFEHRSDGQVTEINIKKIIA
jgi:hypothetical protein